MLARRVWLLQYLSAWAVAEALLRVVVIVGRGKLMRVLASYGCDIVRLESERVEDRRRYLTEVNGDVDRPDCDARPGHDERDMDVLLGESAMLDLLCRHRCRGVYAARPRVEY